MRTPLLLLQDAVATHPLDGTLAEWVWLLPMLPLLGALINGAVVLLPKHRSADGMTTATPSWARTIPTIVAPGVLALSFVLAVGIFLTMRGVTVLDAPFIRNYASWMPVGDLVVNWGIQLDQLSIVMTLVITGVGTLIHLFSIGYMSADPGYARYFSYLNLFVAFMLTLVLGSSYAVLFVGWEGVGLASYLLIGFWFSERANVEAGKKAFVVNRIGDFGFLVAIFLIWATTKSLDFTTAHAALATLPVGAPVLLTIALFLFLGCSGKSAQLPLYIWLPDAMAGPTPVSALIHAATMVTAGVYLVARASPVFAGAPEASLLVATVGALTALFAATIAMRQWDIKKVLAYSTISQLGYMFIGVGTGAYAAGVFHLVTHAFFKALLFLGAGAVIHVMHHAYHHTHRHEDAQDLRNMGGLRRYMPLTALLMLLGTLAISGVFPLSGFFSKDLILAETFSRAHGSPLATASLFGIPGSALLYVIYGIGILTALLTAYYMTRMLVLAFHGANRTGQAEQQVLHEAPSIMTMPLIVLGILTVAGGWLNLPELIPLGPSHLLTNWLEPVTGASAAALSGEAHLSHSMELVLIAVATGAALLGIAAGVMGHRGPITDKANAPAARGFGGLLTRAYGVDSLLDRAVVRPLNGFAKFVLGQGVERGIDRFFTGGGALVARFAGKVGERLQDGDVGKYAWMVTGGVLALLAILLFTT